MRRARILIAEDENIVALDLRDTLRDLGYTIVGVAVTGEGAVKQAAGAHPDLVLMDIRLRGEMDGIEAAEQIRLQLDIPVVYLTAYADERSVQRAKVTEPYGYVLKPFEERELRTVIDIALYKHRIEKRLRQSDRWLAITLGSISDAVVTIDSRGSVSFMNRAAEDMTGWSLGEARGKDLTEIVKSAAPSGRDFVRDAVSRALEGRGVDGFDGNMLLARDGRKIPVDHNVAPLRGEKGEIVGVVLVFRDIGERKRMEKERSQLEAQLREAQKMEAIGLMAGGVAHDFNNLLTVMLGNAELLLSEDAPASQCEELVAIHRAGKQAANLVQQLLAISRRQALRPEIVRPNALVSEVSALLRGIVGEHIEFELHLADGLPAVYADPSSIVQVLMNMVVNARDAMPSGGVLTVETAHAKLDSTYCRTHPDVEPGDYVRLTVADTGVGMDESVLTRLFEPFFTTKEMGKGMGLGLAVAYGIVRQHKGIIDVHSSPGQGTRFDVYLPAHPGIVEESVEMEHCSALRGSETILVAEDEPLVRAWVKSVLEGLGYRVLVAEDGAQAVAVLAQNRDQIDLALLDVVMPKLAGCELYQAIDAQRLEVPLMFMTSYAADLVLAPATVDLAVPVLQKPFTVNQLGLSIREALERAESESERLCPALEASDPSEPRVRAGPMAFQAP